MDMNKIIRGIAIVLAALMLTGSFYTIAPEPVQASSFFTGWRMDLSTNEWYYDVLGVPQKGWLKDKDNWFYMHPETGVMQTGWQKVSGSWYYLADSGVMQKGWQKVSGSWYYLGDSGAMRTSWQKASGSWYFLGDSGAMQTGWQKVSGSWYYLGDSGAMRTGWQIINNKWYYLNPQTGAMKTGWLRQGGRWYFLLPSGAMAENCWGKDGRDWYYFDADGQYVTETVTIDDRLEVFRTNGKYINTVSMDNMAAGLDSSTYYLILVSIDKCVTKIYEWIDGEWIPVQLYLCTVGDPSKGWDTVEGDFYIGYSPEYGSPYPRGYSFVDGEGHTLYYWTRFCDDYLFHSILYDQGTYNVSTSGNALGEKLSHGCVRMRVENAQWIYNNIPDGTRVIVY